MASLDGPKNICSPWLRSMTLSKSWNTYFACEKGAPGSAPDGEGEAEREREREREEVNLSGGLMDSSDDSLSL